MKTRYIFIIAICGIFMACNNNEPEKELTNDTIVEEAVKVDTKDTFKIIEKEDVNGSNEEQKLQLSNEEIVFSFKTNNGKTMNIMLDKEKKYMVYRFGTKNKVELQFPEKLENTFEQFSYSYYFRGGGAMNMGLDLNYLSFKGETHKFVIFDEWSAGESDNNEGNKSLGIKIIDLSTQKEIVIKGKSSTAKGSLIDFRDNGLVKIEEGEM